MRLRLKVYYVTHKSICGKSTPAVRTFNLPLFLSSCLSSGSLAPDEPLWWPLTPLTSGCLMIWPSFLPLSAASLRPPSLSPGGSWECGEVGISLFFLTSFHLHLLSLKAHPFHCVVFTCTPVICSKVVIINIVIHLSVWTWSFVGSKRLIPICY